MSIGFLVIAVIGFSTTFFLPLARGTFQAPLTVHVHGALLFGWLLFFILQATLIQRKKVGMHRQWGWAGVVLAMGVVASGIAIGVFATRRDLAAGGGGFVLGQFTNILIEMLVFGVLVASAIVMRRNGASHKRLLLLATISALAPAWLRIRHLFPAIENPFIVFSLMADSLVVVAIARDWMAEQKVHPVYLWAGGPMIAIHLVELAAIESEPWLRLATWLLGMHAV